MLDILRKHASSWIIKVLLGAIVISFIFFFGYSTMRRSSRPSQIDAVAVVNGTPLSFAEYKFFLDSNYESLRRSFKGNEIPDFVRKMAEASALKQLVMRKLGLIQADELGMVIPDAKILHAIRQIPQAQKDGEFDPIFYRHEFLPYFKQRFGLNYEELIKQDLKLDMLGQLFKDVDRVNPSNSNKGEVEYVWTFETVEIDPNELLKNKAIETAPEAMDLAKLLISLDPKKWKGWLAAFKIAPTKISSITTREHKSLLGGQGSIEDLSKIFTLTAEGSVVATPIESGGKIYVVRLIDRKENKNDKGAFWPARDFFNSWMVKLSAKAKVVSHLKDEQ